MAKHRSSRSQVREAYWRKVLDEWSRSGLTQAAFCRKRASSVYCLRWPDVLPISTKMAT